MIKENLQDRLLNQLRKQKLLCTIHLTNGFQIKGAMVRAFDNFIIVIMSESKQMMLYKHAVSSITMPQPIVLDSTADMSEE